MEGYSESTVGQFVHDWLRIILNFILKYEQKTLPKGFQSDAEKFLA